MDFGYIKLFRKIQDNLLWLKEPFTHGQAWIDLLLLTSYKDGGKWVQGVYVPVKRGQCGWSEIQLAKRWKWSRGKVRRFFELLIQQAQIERETVQTDNRLSGVITIINYEDYQSDGTSDGTSDGQATDKRRYSIKKVKKEKNVKNKDLKTLAHEKNRFDIFWQAYPKKKSKGQAEKAWLKINPSEQLLAAMVATIERAKTSEDWQKAAGQFIPHPATWLNAKGWEDEYAQEIKTANTKTKAGGVYADGDQYDAVTRRFNDNS